MSYINREALLLRLEASPLFGHFGEDGAFIKGFVTEIIEMQPSAEVATNEHIHNLEQSRDYWKAKAEKVGKQLHRILKERA